MAAPIHTVEAGPPLRICVLVRLDPKQEEGPFVLLRELPGARVYLGAVCDAEARVQECVEVWVQALDLRDLAFSKYQERLTNQAFDERWRSENEMVLSNLPETIIATGMEQNNPGPILIKRQPEDAPSAFAQVELSPWRVCKEDTVLQSFGLDGYTTSPYRYLHDPTATGAKTFLAASADAPVNSHVQGIDRLASGLNLRAIFNPHAGLVRVTRFSPLNLEDYLQVLEGRPWSGWMAGTSPLPDQGVYGELQSWSATPRGMPFLLYARGNPAERLNEIFFLKLSLLRDMFKAVQSYVKAQQLPLLNLSPASFSIQLQKTGDPFPAFWAAQCRLTKPGQAYPLKIKSTEQRYCIRLGKVEPSAFLPEGLGAHSFGIGSVRMRSVKTEADGLVLEGTLVAEDYLGLDAHDLLWFKLPLAEERLEFYAHVYSAEAVGPREARFRTVPGKLPDSIVAALKRTEGTAFQKAPYEIWPLLSSPCDMHSLGIMAIRLLLANSQSKLPVIVDEILSLARHLGREATPEQDLRAKLQGVIEGDSELFDLVSPYLLIECEWSPQQARAQVSMDIWLQAVALLLRLFPGTGGHSYCTSFGDVSPLALETVFERPLQEMERLLLRLRSAIVPSFTANEEIASVLLEQLRGI